jgi:hypothetical protein
LNGMEKWSARSATAPGGPSAFIGELKKVPKANPPNEPQGFGRALARLCRASPVRVE